mmetsp:Transcript_10607/g.26593  ORF Transcript_10607/g.26593 Transcript_10607/m.26593 type:complete len:258 (-) Transcript_10607:197-970(-)
MVTTSSFLHLRSVVGSSVSSFPAASSTRSLGSASNTSGSANSPQSLTTSSVKLTSALKPGLTSSTEGTGGVRAILRRCNQTQVQSAGSTGAEGSVISRSRVRSRRSSSTVILISSQLASARDEACAASMSSDAAADAEAGSSAAGAFGATTVRAMSSFFFRRLRCVEVSPFSSTPTSLSFPPAAAASASSLRYLAYTAFATSFGSAFRTDSNDTFRSSFSVGLAPACSRISTPSPQSARAARSSGVWPASSFALTRK